MSDFDFTDKKARAIRSCQTHAMTAELFSRAASTGNAALWNEIARHWTELAELKRRMAATDAHSTEAAADLKNELREKPQASGKL